jgi:hypothetical protein
MKIKITSIFLFISFNLYAQSIPKIKQLLKNKNFEALNKYLDKPKKNIEINWENFRTIVDDYSECTLIIREITPIDELNSSYNEFKINILIKSKAIIYCKLVEIIRSSEKTIIEERNEELYLKLKTAFQKTYNLNLNEHELFLTNVVFGENYGIVGGNPNPVIRKHDLEKIRKALRSANAEMQVYAILELKKLEQKGYKVTDQEQKFIQIVKQKKGSVATCSGCIYMPKSIKDAVSEIDSLPDSYFIPKKNSPATSRSS